MEELLGTHLWKYREVTEEMLQAYQDKKAALEADESIEAQEELAALEEP